MSPGSKSRLSSPESRNLDGRRECLRLRARLVQAIRRFFVEQGYLEVETPQLIPIPTPEAHTDTIKAGHFHLHTSPELCMKRLLSAGYKKIFQITKCFRDSERGDLHLPEFTILEWYGTGIDYETLMGDCEDLILRVCRDLGRDHTIRYQGAEIHLQKPWDRISVNEAFTRYTPLTMNAALEKGLFEELMVREIEPHLGIFRPTVLYDYPAPLAALARLRPDNSDLAERFEIYMGGVELANGFTELTDAQEQRERFERDRQERQRMGKAVYPMPEKFLNALENMPDAAGIALGLDRLVMIFADTSKIDDVVCFTPEEL
jgi:lysyl-tRNA synthetase class 2